MGDLYRHVSVMQGGWNVVKCSYNTCFSVCGEGGISLQTLVLQVLLPRGQTIWHW